MLLGWSRVNEWMKPSVAGCHTLGTPIRQRKPHFAVLSLPVSTEKNQMRRRSTLRKIFSKLFMTTHKMSSPWRESRRLEFQKRNWKVWIWQEIWNIFHQFTQHKTRPDSSRNHMFSDNCFAKWFINFITAKQSPRQRFSKKLLFSRREMNGQSSLLMLILTGLNAFFKFQQNNVILGLILQAVRLLIPSNLCSRSKHLKLKKSFSLRRRESYDHSFHQ